MVARARGADEPFGDYREALKEEATVERRRLKGRWVWRSFIVTKNDKGDLIAQKMPPYRKPRDDTRGNN